MSTAPSMPAIGLQQVTPATPMEMLSRALMSGAAPETLEKLLALQERWEKNMARKAFDRAMAAAKSEIKPIKKNRTVSHGVGKAAYNFADLAEIERSVVPILSEYGLSYRFRTTVTDKQIVVTCILSHQEGHSEETSLPGPADTSGAKNAIQAIGSTVTYLQRYSLSAALGLSATDDDDGVSVGNGKPVDRLSAQQVIDLSEALDEVGRTDEWFCKFAHIGALDDLAPERFDAALAYVKKLPKVEP